VPQAGRYGLELVCLEQIGPADQHHVCSPELFPKQLVDRIAVVQAWIGLALGLEGLGIGHHMATCQRLPINNGDHRMHAGAGTDLRPAEGGHQRLGQGETTGFNNDAIESVSPRKQILHGGQEVILHRAAETAVGKLDQASIKLLIRAESAGSDQGPIDPDLAEFVDHHGQSLAAVQEQLAQKRGFASTEKTGHHRDR